MRLLLSSALAALLVGVAHGQLRDTKSAGGGTDVVGPSRKVGIDTLVGDPGAVPHGPRHPANIEEFKKTGMANMKGHGHAKGSGPEKITEVQADDHHARVHTGGKPQVGY